MQQVQHVTEIRTGQTPGRTAGGLKLQGRGRKFVGFVLSLMFVMPLVSQAENKSTKVNVPPPSSPHEVSAKLCGECHQEIYKEWSNSMHSNSTALDDPIHNAFYRKVMGDPTQEGLKSKKGKYPVCLRCHAPNAAISKKTKLDSKPAFREGINCVFCHTVTAFKGTKKPDGKLRLGQAAYEVSDTSLQAPSGKNYSTMPADDNGSPTSQPFHPFPMMGGNAAVLKTNDICMGCHDRRNNFHGVPLCATGDEIKMSKSEVTCQSCHMPMVEGHANHSMAGGHDGNMVRRAVTIKLDLVKAEGAYQATVKMKNLLPHKFPTGAPFRIAYLKLAAYDDEGKLVWQNFKEHPLKDDPQAVLVYTLGNKEGKPSMPPKATQVLGDTRLEPHKERSLQYKISGENIKVVKAEIMYNLLLPKLNKKLDKVLTQDLKESKVVATSEVRL